jgi:hypothetical protein
VVGSVKAISAPLLFVGSLLGSQGVAGALYIDPVKDWLGRRVLRASHEEGFVCFKNAEPFDLDGDAVKSDIAVVFYRTATRGDCSRPDLSPLDAAFFRLAWDGFRYVGETDYPNDVAWWNFKGPAAFRLAAYSNHPDVEVYMLRDGKIARVANIGTLSQGGYAAPEFFESRDGKSAWVITASVSKAGMGKDGRPFVQQVDGKSLAAENEGSHLLSYDLAGNLTFDGERLPGAVSDPKEGDEFSIVMSPGSRLYMVGCTPDAGLIRSKESGGAFLVDLSQKPAANCNVGEDTYFTVRIVPVEHL